MPSLRRLSRPFALLLAGILIGAALTPLALRASQQLFALSPGDSLVVTCETSIGGYVTGAQARIECAAPDSGAEDDAPPAAIPTPAPADEAAPAVELTGLRAGQVVSGVLVVEALVAGGDAARVVFTLDGPQPARHTERRAPYFFLGDDGGRPRGWDTATFPDGDYTLAVELTTADGQTAEERVSFRVANGALPDEGEEGPGTLPDRESLDDPPAARGALEYGVAAHLFYIDRRAPLDAVRRAGFGWVRQQIHWKDIEGPTPGNYAWGELDPLVDEVDRAGLRLLIAVVRSPAFHTADGGDGLPADPRTFGDFVAALAERYRGKVQAIEVWNEQNLAHENGGRVTLEDAGRYVELLREAYTRIKAVDESIVVLAGPPSSTGITDPAVAVSDTEYLAAMYSYQGGVIRDYFDAQAVHPGGAANPPETFPGDAPSTADGWTDHPTFYFRHVENVRQLMVEHGLEDRPVWITEFGWATRNTTPGYEFGNQVSYQEQAEYIVGAMRWTAEHYPWVEAMFLWNLNFAPLHAKEGQPLHEQASFSILDGAGRPRPAYIAVQRYLAGR